MKLALKLAGRGCGHASPNPMVGAVLVKGDRIIGQGYHRVCGGPHAEVNAIESASEDVAGATLYVTLEPCCHHGRTPPCTERIIRHRIGRVVIGTVDANPMVSCRGISALVEAGIDVQTGILEAECRLQNEVFFHFMETKTPFVTVKFAQTLDGRIATATGSSRWISSPASLKFVHKLRATHDAICVGIGTAIHDDPELTVRLVRGRHPVRIIVDSTLRLPDTAKVLQTATSPQTIIATTLGQDHPRARALQTRGARILTLEADATGRVAIEALLVALAKENISSLLVEGGSGIITSFLARNRVNRLIAVIAPKIIGRGTETVGDLGIHDLAAAKRLVFQKVTRLGDDVVLDTRLVQSGHELPGGAEPVER